MIIWWLLISSYILGWFCVSTLSYSHWQRDYPSLAEEGRGSDFRFASTLGVLWPFILGPSLMSRRNIAIRGLSIIGRKLTDDEIEHLKSIRGLL